MLSQQRGGVSGTGSGEKGRGGAQGILLGQVGLKTIARVRSRTELTRLIALHGHLVYSFAERRCTRSQ